MAKKELSEFYKHKRMPDGHLNICKDCKRSDARKDYDKNKQSIEWIFKERERTRERNIRLGYSSKYRHLDRKQYSKRWQERYPEKRTAQNKLANALRSKKLTKNACQVCGEMVVDAHHEDYSKPLEVQWLCRKHHMEVHRKAA